MLPVPTPKTFRLLELSEPAATLHDNGATEIEDGDGAMLGRVPTVLEHVDDGVEHAFHASH